MSSSTASKGRGRGRGVGRELELLGCVLLVGRHERRFRDLADEERVAPNGADEGLLVGQDSSDSRGVVVVLLVVERE